MFMRLFWIYCGLSLLIPSAVQAQETTAGSTPWYAALDNIKARIQGLMEDNSRLTEENRSLQQQEKKLWADIEAQAQKNEQMRQLLKERNGKTDQQVQWDAEKAAAQDCPKGRIKITGTVLKTDLRESQWGDQLKVTIKDERGFVVWMTCPSSLAIVQAGEFQRGLERGDKVEVTATIEPSEKDAKFGFGKRPVGGKVLALVS